MFLLGSMFNMVSVIPCILLPMYKIDIYFCVSFIFVYCGVNCSIFKLWWKLYDDDHSTVFVCQKYAVIPEIIYFTMKTGGFSSKVSLAFLNIFSSFDHHSAFLLFLKYLFYWIFAYIFDVVLSEEFAFWKCCFLDILVVNEVWWKIFASIHLKCHYYVLLHNSWIFFGMKKSIRIITGYFSLKFGWYSQADSYFAGKLFVNSMMLMCVT